MLLQASKLLRRILLDGVAALGPTSADAQQVAFVAPDARWRSSTIATSRPVLSVHLVDLRENVKLRSSERVEERVGTTVRSRRAPYRMDCHYLVSAFAQPNAFGDPPAQHALLYEATAALVRSQPLVPAKVFLPGSSDLAEWPEAFRDVELPMLVNPHEGFPKLAELWGTLHGEHPWEPAVYVVVTIPVEHDRAEVSGIVRRQTTTYRFGLSAEALVDIGGVVLDGLGNAVPGALVVAEDGAGELARTSAGDDGRFVLALPARTTRLYAAAFGRGRTPALPVSGATTEFTLKFP